MYTNKTAHPLDILTWNYLPWGGKKAK